jgi:pilus retraction protein PilT
MSQILDFLRETVARNASDLHLKPARRPFFRIASNLEESSFPALTADDLHAIVDEILPPHQTDYYQTYHEADFSFFREGLGRFRVNVFQSHNVPAVAFRYVKDRIPTMEELHLPPALTTIAGAPRGIVILSGTTGSGKSTTLASMIDYINHLERQRIITIEDPVEYLFRDHLSLITQREVGIDTQSFHAALVHIMRQDPDIIVIGEMRDETSFKTALDAAETGHLVFSTMHSGNAAVAVQRILQFFPTNEWEQARLALAGNLHAIICQRLLRGAQGGLFPAVELLINTSTVRKLIEKDRLDVISAAIETGVDDGMLTFNQSIYKLIKNGQVTEQEGMLHATNPAALRMNLQGIFLDEGKRILAT